MEIQENQDEYFTSYEDLDVHELMLKDTHRTEAYRQSIAHSEEYFKDKIVMDVGCGTGILSIFCAQAGAKKVYAVEASDVANIAKEVVKENNFEEVIEVIHSRVEDVTLPGDIKVDAIVSEWMGFYLLHEGMLDSVVIARDKFLKEDGQMFPENACLYVAPCSLPSFHEKWDNIYEVRMKSFAKHLRDNKRKKPQIMEVHQDHLLDEGAAILWLDLLNVKLSELDSFNEEVVVVAKRQGMYQGLCLWFTCFFPGVCPSNTSFELSTGPVPLSNITHWKQTVVVLPEEQEVDRGEPIAYRISLNRDSQCSRRYNIEVTMLDPELVQHPLPCECHMTRCIVMKAFLSQHPERENYHNSNKEEENLLAAARAGVLENHVISDEE